MARVLRGWAVVWIALSAGCAVARPGLTYVEPEYDFHSDPMAMQQVQAYEQPWALPAGVDLASVVLP